MKNEKSLSVVQKGIRWLEERAKVDNSWVHPSEQELFLTHHQMQMEYARVDKSDITLTQLNLKSKNQSSTKENISIFINYEDGLKEFEKNRERRNKNRNKIKAENEKNFFKPADKALLLNEEAITLTLIGEYEQGNELFHKAYQSFPKITEGEFRSTNDAYLAILFNLGKSYFNEGYLEEGFNYLSRYYRFTKSGDFVRDSLETLFQIQIKRRDEMIAHYEGIDFRMMGGDIEIDTNGINTFSTLKFPYKQPISLGLETKSKEFVELSDYFYLHELSNPDSNVCRFELMLPLNKISVFKKEYYSIILEDMNISYEPLEELDYLISESMVAENQEKNRKYHEYPEFKSENFKSLAVLTVKKQYKYAFLNEFSHFIKMYVDNQLSEDEMEEKLVSDYKRKFDNLSIWFRYELLKEYKNMQMHHRETAKVYADLKVLEQNLMENKKDLFNTVNHSSHHQYQKKYLEFLNNIFRERKKEIIKIEANFGDIRSIQIRNKAFKSSFTNKWDIMMQLLEKEDPVAAMAKIRGVLEEVLSKILEQEQEELYRGNYRLTPTQMVMKIEKKIGQEVKENILQLHQKSKNYSHFEGNDYLQESNNEKSYCEAVELLNLLKKTTLNLVNYFEL